MRPSLRFGALLVLLLAGCLGPTSEFTGGGLLSRPEPVVVEGGGLLVRGQPFLLKAVDEEPGNVSLARMAAMKEAGFNAVRLRTAAGADVGGWLDAASAVDLKVVLVLDGPTGDSRALERALRILLARHAQHPALLFWQVGEGWEAGRDAGGWISELQRLARIAAVEDPRHPVASAAPDLSGAARLAAEAPAVALLALPVPAQAAWESEVWQPWREHVGPRPLVAVPAAGSDLAASWEEVRAHHGGDPVAGAVLARWEAVAGSAGLEAARVRWGGDGFGSPPAILGLERTREGEVLRLATRVVAYAGQNVSVQLHFRSGSSPWQSAPMTLEGGRWSASLHPQDSTLLFLRVRAVDDSGRDRTSPETVMRPAPLPWLALAALALAAQLGRSRRA